MPAALVTPALVGLVAGVLLSWWLGSEGGERAVLMVLAFAAGILIAKVA